MGYPHKTFDEKVSLVEQANELMTSEGISLSTASKKINCNYDAIERYSKQTGIKLEKPQKKGPYKKSAIIPRPTKILFNDDTEGHDKETSIIIMRGKSSDIRYIADSLTKIMGGVING